MKTDPVKLPLDMAERIAAKVRDALAPFCERIEIAGSIRRWRPVCGDIDVVCLPRDPAGLHQRLARNTRAVKDGAQNIIRLLDVPGVGAVQIDCYIAHSGRAGLFDSEPGNWGTLLLCRTGSPRHNIRICERAKDRGLTWDPYRGIIAPGGQILAAASEEEIYAVLGLPWHEPPAREAPEF